jgi:diacylglycerol O-acyltransferase
LTSLEPGELAPLDALMLKTDADPALRAVMTAVLVLDGAPDWARVVSVFEAATVKVPRLRQKVVAPLLPVGPPRWVPDHDFDMACHLRRAAAPGDVGLPQVLEVVSGWATAPFDRSRPLWEATLFEGTRGGGVFVLRAHHALADGVGAMQILGALLDLEPGPAGSELPAAGPVIAGPTPARLLLTRLAEASWQLTVGLLERNLSLAVTAGRFAVLPRRPGAGLASWTGSLRRLMSANGATPSGLLRERSRGRCFAALDLPLAGLKEAANAAGCTVNDAYLAGLLGGFRRYHEKLGAKVTDVPMALPINVRGTVAGVGGNQFSAAVLSGPATIEDPAGRMRHIADLVQQARAERALDATARLAPLLAQLPGVFATTALAAHARRIDLQASNLIGAPVPTYLAGCRVRRLYPFGPLPGIPVMAVLLSHDGTCCIGLNLDPAAIDDLPLFITCLSEAFDEIMAGRGTATPAAAPQ